MRAAFSLLALPVLLLSACAGTSGDASSLPALERGQSTLTVLLDRGEETGSGDPQEYTLTCASVAEGTLPSVKAACKHLAGLDDPFAPVPTDAICTEVYGGDQTARITGSWEGDEVDLSLSRTDGCRISQWDSLAPLLPV